MLMTNYSGSLVFVLMTLYKDLLRAVCLKIRIVDVNDTLSEYDVVCYWGNSDHKYKCVLL